MCETVKGKNQDAKKVFLKCSWKTRFHMIEKSLMGSLMGCGGIWPPGNFNSAIITLFLSQQK